MPALKRLLVSGIRNIDSAELEPSPTFNLISGDNGSGKTSLLEAIHFLSLGRSFRTHQHKPLIQDGRAQAVVFGETTEGVSLGVSRTGRKGDGAELKLNGVRAETLAAVTHELPVQLLNSDTFALIEGGPQQRRAFLDWGVFHVKHQFLPAWRKARRALLNRNALLKRNAPDAELAPWSRELAVHAQVVDELRAAYLALLQQQLGTDIGAVLEDMLGYPLSLQYQRGWDDGASLEDLLQAQVDKERRYGYTLFGPHRAELLFSINRKPCAELLSRGQMKLTIAILKIAQAQLLEQTMGRRCVFLVDDLPAELDRANQALVCSHLERLQAQTFITSIEPEALPALGGLGSPARLFHVKHGKIAAV